MADFLLSVGVDVGLSYDQMQKDISNLVSRLNSNPPKIKVCLDIDNDSTADFRAQISKINKVMEDTRTTSGASIDTTRTAVVASNMADVATRTREASNAIYSMNTSLSKCNTEKISNAVQSLNGISPLGASEIAKNLSDANVKIDTVKTKWHEIENEEQQILDLRIKGTNSLGQSLTCLISFDKKTNEIKSKTFDINTSYKGLENTINSINAKSSKSGNVANLVKSYREAKLAINDYYAVLRKISSENIDVIKTSKGYMSKSGDWSGIAVQVNAVKEAYTAIRKEMTLMPEEQKRAILKLLEKQEMALAVAIEARKNATNRASASSKKDAEKAAVPKDKKDVSKDKTAVLNKETKEYYTALKQINTLLTQVTHSQKRWTAAKKGMSSTAYNDLGTHAQDLKNLENKLRNGALTIDQFRSRIIKLRSDVSSATTTIKGTGEATQTLGQRVGTLSTKFGTWFGISRVIMYAYRTVRKMISNVIELDTAMTELKKVTDETDEVYDRFLVKATQRAKRVGATLSDTVTATADFARLGFGIKDAEKLADAAIVYKNVGDGIADVGTASSSIIATMQAFGIEADQVMNIVDKFNKIGNKYAISSKGVGEALLRSAAAMHAANNSLDETIALATAANTVVQDPEKVGITLKTVSMYLRAAKTEAEDAGESTEGMASSVSKLRDELLVLTGNKVDIQIDEDTFKSTYQIIKELSKVWGELSDISQANITEMIGGKRNSNVISALLENFSVAENALNTSANSEGSALTENEKVLESIQGRLNILKSTFETFSENMVSSGVTKWFISLLTGLIEIMNIGKGTVGILTAITASVLGLRVAIKAGKLTSLAGKLTSLAGRVKMITLLVCPPQTDGNIERVDYRNGVINESLCSKQLKWCA